MTAIRGTMAALRRRLRLQAGLSGAAQGAAAGLAVLLLASLWCGTVVTPAFARLAWLVIAAAAALGLARGLSPLREFAGDRLTRVFDRHSAVLPSRVRSALELQVADPNCSDALRRAHLAQVASALDGVSAPALLPWRAMRGPWLWAALIGAPLLLFLLWGYAPARNGARSLLRPAQLQGDGSLRAPVVRSLRARLVFPSYLRRQSELQQDPTRITAPRGTTLELQVVPAVPADEGRVLVGDQDLRLRAQDGLLVGRLVMRHSGALTLRLSRDGRWYEDDTPRALQALPDDHPEVELVTPVSGTWVQADAPQSIRVRASDDAGLTEIRAVVRLPGGGERRRRLWSSMQQPAAPTELDELLLLSPAAIGVRPGDQFELWLEAVDSDVVTGPNVGRSATVVLEAASDAQHLSRHIPHLRAILDQALTNLADRLERPLSAQAVDATSRFGVLRGKAQALVTDLDRLVQTLREGEQGETGLDADDLGGARDRLRKLLRREQRLYAGSPVAPARRARADEQAVEELERDALLFEDMLSLAHVDEAAALAEELERLRTRISELLSELEVSDSKEARDALMAEIARAERRLRDLMRSLSQMATRVPTEFVNQDAMDPQRSDSTMRDLRSAVESGDLDAAARHLESLQEQLARLTEGLQQGGLRMQQQRRGPRNEAMSAAHEQLAMLADEQGRLAQRSADRLRDAYGRAGGAGGQANEALRHAAESLEQQLQRLSSGSLPGHQAQALDQARQRARDTRDLLQSGDLSEARSMAGATARALRQTADSMEMEARMYQGRNGPAQARAEQARRASAQAAGLEQRIDGQIPRRADTMTPQQRAQMEADARAQAGLEKRARALRDTLEQGPDGLPLSPDAARTLGEASRRMGDARQGLQQGKARDAASEQQQATEQLQQVAEQLRRKQQPHGAGAEPDHEGAEGEGGGGGEERVDSSTPVRIPAAEDFHAPQAMRRRVLDAMKQPSPQGYERAVERYYRELLR